MRLYSRYALAIILSLVFIFYNISFASDPREWSPTWKLPPGKKPANIVDESITVPGEVKKVSSSVQFPVAPVTQRYSRCGVVPHMPMHGGIRYFRHFITWGKKLQKGNLKSEI